MNFSTTGSRLFHVHAVTPLPPVPEPLTRLERHRLSETAKTARLNAEISYVDSLVVPTAAQRDFGTAFDDLIRTVAGGPPGAQPALLVMGPAGTGKSTAVREAAWRLHQREIGPKGRRDPKRQPLIKGDGYTAWHIPVVWIDLTAAVQGKGVMGPLLNFCGHPDSGTGYALAGRCVDVAERHRWRVVVLDDVHNLALRRADSEAIYNTLKQLNTALGQLGVAFVYLSTPERGKPREAPRPTLLNNEQLASRLRPVEFEPFEPNFHSLQSAETVAWQTHLLRWEAALLPVLSGDQGGFLTGKHAKRLYYLSGGRIGELAVLLKQAAYSALVSGRLHLTGGDMDKVLASARVLDSQLGHTLVGRS
jgi:AAA domain